MRKPSSFLYFFKRLNKMTGGAAAWRWKPKSSLRWKIKRFDLHHWFVDNFIFKIVSVLEAVALISAACFFFLCCGGHL